MNFSFHIVVLLLLDWFSLTQIDILWNNDRFFGLTKYKNPHHQLSAVVLNVQTYCK